MTLTRKSASAPRGTSRLARAVSAAVPRTMDRRTFLKRSGMTAGAGAFASALPFSMVERARAADTPAAGGKVEIKRTICTHCSVGCAIDAEVVNGVWVGQEPVFDSPINMGANCAKGASIREHGHG
ncbi:MAG: twin-arginine translocation signal domain-containing protein, partial [Methyloversatilis sp.]